MDEYWQDLSVDKERTAHQSASFQNPSKHHIWGEISIMGKTDLKTFTKNFKQKRYKTVLNVFYKGS